MWISAKKLRLDKEQEEKIASSQNALLDAAISTVEMAQYVTSKLKDRLDDAVRQFDSTIAIMQDALLICDIDGQIKACNPAAQTIFQYDLYAMMQLTVLDLFHSHEGTVANLWSILKPDADQETIGIKGVRQDGINFPCEITLTQLDRSDGTSVMLILIRDISELEQLKEDSENNARRYRSLFDLTFDSILIVQNDQIVAANKQAGRMFGCKSEQLLAKKFTKIINMDCHKQLTEGCINCDCGRQSLDDELIHEANAIQDDGATMSLLFSGTDIVWNGDKACLITARDTIKQFDRRLDNGIDMICFFDKNFNITFANEAFCIFYKVCTVGNDIRKTMSETERNAFMLNISNLSVDRPIRRIQFYVDLQHVQDWIDHAVFDADGNVVEIQHSVRDITDFVKEVMNS